MLYRMSCLVCWIDSGNLISNGRHSQDTKSCRQVLSMYSPERGAPEYSTDRWVKRTGRQTDMQKMSSPVTGTSLKPHSKVPKHMPTAAMPRKPVLTGAVRVTALW